MTESTARLSGALGAAVVLGLGAGAARGQPPSSPPVSYHGVGIVRALLPPPSSLHATRPVIVIEHEPIAGLMDEKMTMPFLATSTALFRGLQPGDHVAFGLQDTPGALLVVTIERLGIVR